MLFSKTKDKHRAQIASSKTTFKRFLVRYFVANAILYCSIKAADIKINHLSIIVVLNFAGLSFRVNTFLFRHFVLFLSYGNSLKQRVYIHSISVKKCPAMCVTIKKGKVYYPNSVIAPESQRPRNCQVTGPHSSFLGVRRKITVATPRE